MRYPSTLSEAATLQAAIAGRSIARFGDGELSICRGGSSVSQRADPRLRVELLDILAGKAGPVLPCVPNLDGRSPRAKYWERYGVPPYSWLMTAPEFGSSFITRPDNAPWIDNAEYWATVRKLWTGKGRVLYVGGDRRLFDVIALDTDYAALFCAKRDAYAGIDAIERECASIGLKTVVIALGAAGTALAARLARKGFHALDLGHIGMFMQPENQGAFAFSEDQLTTPQYRELIRKAHRETNWGRGGASWAEPIAAFAKELGTVDVLDYGAGGRTLAPALATRGIKCKEYDPGVPDIAAPPKLADLVVSTDVFEHIEPALIPNVLRHAYLLARTAGYFVIAKQPAKKILADGRNAHLSCHEADWWIERLREAGWTKIKIVSDEWKKCVIKCRKD